MKNIHTKQEFLLIKEQSLNEGLFSFLKNIFKSIGKLYDKIKGGKELKQKIEDYKDKINKIFLGLNNAENAKSAANKNVQAAIESKIYEEDGYAASSEDDGEPATSQQKGEDVKPNPIDQKQTAGQEDNTNNLDKTQLKGKINVSKKHIEELKKNFNNEIEALKKKYTGKDGKISKKLEQALLLAKNQISDHIFEQWEEHYTKIGDKKTIANIQKQRAQIAKEMKTNTETLQQMMESSDKEQRTFEIDKKYNYTNSEGNEVEITVKEIENDGTVKSAELTNSNGEIVTINPYTNKIGKKVEEPQEEQIEKNKNVQKEGQPQNMQKSQA